MARDFAPGMDSLLVRLQQLAPSPQWRRMLGRLASFPTVSSLDVFFGEGVDAVEAELFEAGEEAAGFPEL